MEYYKLPAYNKARELTIQFLASSQKLPRDVKFTFGRECTLMNIYMMKDIADANDDIDQRVESLEQSLQRLHEFNINIRVLLDLHMISKKGFAAISTKSAELERQLSAWKQSAKNK